jgi:uncharacterized SAM-binding protein YcdF (DUF218 family)
MRWLIGFIFKIVFVVVAVSLLVAVWLVLDGLHDTGQKADVGLVVGHADSSGKEQPQLDRVVELYRQGAFPIVIVSASTPESGKGDAEAMSRYLEEKGLPPSAIITDRKGDTTLNMAHSVAGIMRDHQYESLLLVTEYYHVIRAQWALEREGIDTVEKAHVGAFQKKDALSIGREVAAFYVFLGKYYLLPEAEKVKKEAAVGADKAKVEAEKAKESVDQKIDSMAK